MITTSKFARKPFLVDAVQVTAENMEEVARWCRGAVIGAADTPGDLFIRVKVHRPASPRQTEAHVDDWVLYAGTGFKVYNPIAFEKSFERAGEQHVSRSAETGRFVSHDQAEENPATTVNETI